MKLKIPLALIVLRLIIGFAILCLSIAQVDNYTFLAILLLAVGLLTDIFDGIIARQLNISTQKLRRLDSTVDQVFFTSAVVATYIQCPEFFKSHAIKLIVLISFECLTYLASYFKFRKEIATHSIGAKVWTLLLFATIIQIISQCQSTILFNICFWVGIVTRLEILMIVLTLKKWTHDVPTFYHAIKLRKDKEIKRHKIFNG